MPRGILDSHLQNLFVSGALLDKTGRIIEVSEGWKQFARTGKLNLENYAIGQDYLRHTIFADESSVTILRGLKSLLNKEIDVFSTIYRCDTPAEVKWFVLMGFLVDNGSDAVAAVLHIDISSFLNERSSVSASMVGVGPGVVDPTIEKLTRAVRQTIATTMQNSAIHRKQFAEKVENRAISGLTPHQLRLLAFLARGATNLQIAKAQDISVGSVKNQTGALLRKLGVANRTQAALLAVQAGVLDRDDVS